VVVLFLIRFLCYELGVMISYGFVIFYGFNVIFIFILNAWAWWGLLIRFLSYFKRFLSINGIRFKSSVYAIIFILVIFAD